MIYLKVITVSLFFLIAGCADNGGGPNPIMDIGSMARLAETFTGNPNIARARSFSNAFDSGQRMGNATISARSGLNPGKIKRIAILVEKGRNVPDGLIENQFLSTMIGKNYDVISRTDAALAVKEIAFQNSSITESKAAQFGRILNVPSVLIVKLNQNDTSRGNYGSYSNVQLGARILDVQTTRVVWLGSNTGSAKTGQSTNSLLARLASSIAVQMPTVPR